MEVSDMSTCNFFSASFPIHTSLPDKSGQIVGVRMDMILVQVVLCRKCVQQTVG